MLDPIKVSVTTPGMSDNGELKDKGIPAALLTSYLDAKGIVVEKRQTLLFCSCFLSALPTANGEQRCSTPCLSLSATMTAIRRWSASFRL